MVTRLCTPMALEFEVRIRLLYSRAPALRPLRPPLVSPASFGGVFRDTSSTEVEPCPSALDRRIAGGGT